MKRLAIAACLVCLGLAVQSVPAWGAESPNPEPVLVSIDEMMTRARNAVKAGGVTSEVDLPVEDALKKCAVNRDIQCNAAIDLNDRKWKEEFAQQSYAWHLFSSKLIFCLVVAIVLFGLYVTYIQFNRDYRDWSPAHHVISAAPTVAATVPAVTPTVTAGPPEGQAAAETAVFRPVTSLKLSAGGLELSSQVIGLIVLALSFAFFYLYVKEIHPMVERHSDLVPALKTLHVSPESGS